MDAARHDEAPSESPDDEFFDSSVTSDGSSEDEEASAGDCSPPETYYLMGIVGGQRRKRSANKIRIIENMMRVHKTSFGDESPNLTAREVHSTPQVLSPLHRSSRQFGSFDALAVQDLMLIDPRTLTDSRQNLDSSPQRCRRPTRPSQVTLFPM